MSAAVSVGIVGTGWRAEFFARLAQDLPGLSLAGFAVRRPESGEKATAQWGVPAYLSPSQLVRGARPDFVVVSVPWATSPAAITELVKLGVPVLGETPPAPDLEGLRSLWQAVGQQRLVQVAEQYLLMPGHVARRELISRGVIGTPTSAHVSSTHGYHAVSMIRGMLGVGFEQVRVSGKAFTAPLVDPITRDGWSGADDEKPAQTTLATLDFGEKHGLYDFTDNQWHNRLRSRRMIIRGSRGEIADDQVVRLVGPEMITTSSLVRSQLGHDLSLAGFDTEHLSFDGEVVYRNPFIGHRLMDEEIAIASMMIATGAWIRDEGPEPYPLAAACQDHLISLAINEAVASGQTIETTREVWADG